MLKFSKKLPPIIRKQHSSDKGQFTQMSSNQKVRGMLLISNPIIMSADFLKICSSNSLNHCVISIKMKSVRLDEKQGFLKKSSCSSHGRGQDTQSISWA